MLIAGGGRRLTARRSRQTPRPPPPCHWARSAHDPLAARLGAARGGLLAFAGRLARRRGAAPARWSRRRPGTRSPTRTRCSRTAAFFRSEDRPDEALACLDRVLTIADDQLLRAMTSLETSLVHLDCDAFEAAVRHAQRASALARDLGPAARAGTIGIEAQARLFAGQFDEAARLEAESQRDRRSRGRRDRLGPPTRSSAISPCCPDGRATRSATTPARWRARRPAAISCRR